MKPLEELVKDVERDLIISLVISTEHKGLAIENSAKIAKNFISYFPFKNYDDLFERLYFLSNSYREVRKVYVKYSPAYEREKSEEMLTKIREQMKRKNFEKALKVARGIEYARA